MSHSIKAAIRNIITAESSTTTATEPYPTSWELRQCSLSDLVRKIYMYKETSCHYQIAQDKHKSLQVIRCPILQIQFKNIKRVNSL